MKPFVSRAGQKLQHALDSFGIDPTGWICADLGCSTGGFVDCLLENGAAKVYAVDTGYGVLDWKLRNDRRVIVMERTNALHVALPEKIDLVTVDAGWTRQKLIIPAAAGLLRAGGKIISLLKPHYEAEPRLLRHGVLPPESAQIIIASVQDDLRGAGFEIAAATPSPIRGTGGNVEALLLINVPPPI